MKALFRSRGNSTAVPSVARGTISPFLFACGVLCALALAGCESAGGGSSTPGGTAAVLQPGDPGYPQTFSAGGYTFSLITVPGGMSFPSGESDADVAAVSDDYWMATTEVPYGLWYAVRQWAVSGSGGAPGEGLYSFANPGREGSGGSPGAAPVGGGNEPVTGVSWRDALVWCNALTEWYNALSGTSLAPAYLYNGSPVRSSQPWNSVACDSTAPDHSAGGFRLPSGAEWELAARWRDDALNGVTGWTDPCFTAGRSLSGAAVLCDDVSDGPTEPARSANDLVAVYRYYFESGGIWHSNGTAHTATVGTRQANSLGLHDMSGNAAEWCFEKQSLARGVRGGSWYDEACFATVASRLFKDAGTVSDEIGFRVARSGF